MECVIVSGGSGLLGRSVVHHLLGLGIKVAVPYLSEDEWRQFRGAVTDGGLFGKQTDLADQEATDLFVQWARERFGAPIDALVCAAGGWVGGSIADTSFAKWSQMISMNLTSVFTLCHAVVPEMQVRNAGRIVTIGGRGGLDGRHGVDQVAYAASKGGVIAFTEALAAEVWKQNVKVNCIVPSGIVPTADAESTEGVTPEELTKTICHLLSEDASHISGAVIKTYGTKPMA